MLAVKNVLGEAMDIAEGKEFGDKIRSTRLITSEETAKAALAVNCFNNIQRLIGYDYEPLVKELNVSGGRAEYSSLSYIPIKILAAYDSNGKEVWFKEFQSYATFDNSAVKIYAKCVAKDSSLNSNFEYEYMKMGKTVFVYGVLMEYCLAQGRFDEAKAYSERFFMEAEKKRLHGKKMRARKDWGL